MSGDDESDRELLSRFVLRARIVREHSLATSLDVLKQWAKMEFKVVQIVDKVTDERRTHMKRIPLIPTEQLESAAARVRPIYLKSDGVHYSKPIAALKRLHPNEPKQEELLDNSILPQFQAADLDRPKGELPPHAPRSNKDLAGSWLYGELLHDDPVRRSIGALTSIEQRYFAAMKLICSQMIPVVRLLEHIESAHDHGLLGLPDDVFTKSVIVTTPALPPREVKIYVNEAGAIVPTGVDDDLESSGWEVAKFEEMFEYNPEDK